MRYAIVTETYPPEVNGVALTVQALEHGLRRRGHQVSLIRPRQSGEAASDVVSEWRVRGIGLPYYPGLRVGMPATAGLVERWKRHTPDAIYVATEGLLGWSALRAARRLGIPVATGFHTRFDHYMRDYGLSPLQSLAMRWMRHFHNLSQATLVPTQELAEFLSASGFSNVQRLARAVDTQHFDPDKRSPALRASLLSDVDGPLVIHVGRLAAEKNLALAVDAFRAIQARRPDARMVWVGDGPERAGLAAANPDFIFTGTLRGDALATHFASADLFLFPSLSETFGNVTLEALASGVPTVAFNYGAAREHLRDGVHGAAVEDAPSFIAAALQLASDRSRRASMGKACRTAMLHLHPGQVAADFDTLLSELSQIRRLYAIALSA